MDFRTKEGENANNWFTRSAHDALTGERWVLVKDDPDPRKRQWVKYDRNGKVVNKKTGALNIGGNITQLAKGGIYNLANLHKGGQDEETGLWKTNWGGTNKENPDITNNENPGITNNENLDYQNAFNTDLQATEGWTFNNPTLTEGFKDLITNNAFLDSTDGNNLRNLYSMLETDLVNTELDTRGIWDQTQNLDWAQHVNKIWGGEGGDDDSIPTIGSGYEHFIDQDSKPGDRSAVTDEIGRTDETIETTETKRPRTRRDFKDLLADRTTAKENWNNLSSWDRQRAKSFAKGDPRQRMQISHARSTFSPTLFKSKAKDPDLLGKG